MLMSSLDDFSKIEASQNDESSVLHQSSILNGSNFSEMNKCLKEQTQEIIKTFEKSNLQMQNKNPRSRTQKNNIFDNEEDKLQFI